VFLLCKTLVLNKRRLKKQRVYPAVGTDEDFVAGVETRIIIVFIKYIKDKDPHRWVSLGLFFFF